MCTIDIDAETALADKYLDGEYAPYTQDAVDSEGATGLPQAQEIKRGLPGTKYDRNQELHATTV